MLCFIKFIYFFLFYFLLLSSPKRFEIKGGRQEPHTAFFYGSRQNDAYLTSIILCVCSDKCHSGWRRQ